MASTPREIGTLIVVVLKAKNLPNKRHIGKQDPFCTVVYNGEKRRTKAIRRGGQHPEWDEEIRFTLFEDLDADGAYTANGGTPPPPPKTNGKGSPKIKGGNALALSCYAEDPREPDLIGETSVDLTEVLTKGETDEWFTLMNKEKYCGEVYLELTFWSNEPPPAKKATAKPKTNKQYGGPGSFVPTGEPSSEADARLSSSSSYRDELSRDSIPPSLRSSSSVARLDLYVPAYETTTTRSHHSSLDSMANDFAEMGVKDNIDRSLSFPSQQGHPLRPSSFEYPESQSMSSHASHGYHQSTYADSLYSDGGYTYDPPVTPTGPLPYPQSSAPVNHEPYQAPYESTPPPQGNYQTSGRHAGPRFSLSMGSSGFISAPTPAPSGFVSLSSHVQPSGFAPLSTLTPAPLGYGPPPSHIPVPSSSFPTLQPSSVPSPFSSTASSPSATYHPLPQPIPPHSYSQYVAALPSSSFTHHTLPAPPTSSAISQVAPPQAYGPPVTTFIPVQSQSTHPADQQQLVQMATGSSSHEPIPPPPPLPESPPTGQVTNSRPLPTPRPRRISLPAPPTGIQQYSTSVAGNAPLPSSMSYGYVPPPPPLPQRSSAASTFSQTSYSTVSIPPPPIPPPAQPRQPLVRRPSLPAPPPLGLGYQQQPSAFEALPPPPPPPSLPSHAAHGQVVSFPVSSQSQTFYPGPPPRPPIQLQTQYAPVRVSPPSAHAGY